MLITLRRLLLDGGAMTLSVRFSLATTEKLKLERYTNKIAKMYYNMITTVLLPLSVPLTICIVINQIFFALYMI